MKHILHILTTNSVPKFIASDAAVLLIRDATYLLLNQLEYQTLYVLKNDLTARGLTANNAQAIDYDEFVTLTMQYGKIITWT